MLTRSHRLTSRAGFGKAVRAGRRAGTRSLVLHLAVDQHAESTGEPEAGADPVRVGFVVSKAVGTAVTRNLVKRRLRHLARERLTLLPGSAVLVVRALPAAADASYVALAADFDSALGRLIGERSRMTAAASAAESS